MNRIKVMIVDDSAVVLMALSKVRMAQTDELQDSIRRGAKWVLAMQGSDGGWGAYDKDNNRIVFNYIPFADHHALLRETLTVARMPHIGPDRVSLSAIEQTGQLDQFKLAGISSG